MGVGLGDLKDSRGVLAIAAAACFLAWIGTYAGYFPNAEGRLGHDYERYLAQLLDGYFWSEVNGYLTVPWFTPSFCAGLPKFGHPNGIYVSLPQWLTLIISPLFAIKLTVIAFAGIGFGGMWLLLRQAFGLAGPLALTGAAMFLWNGLYVHRMIVGHLTFHGFMLLPLQAFLLAMLIDSRADRRRCALALAALVLTGAYQFTSGMVHLAGPVALALIGIGALYTRDRPRRMLHWLLWGGAGTVLALLLVAGPLAASLAFLGNFKRDLYSLPGFADPLAQLTTAAFAVLARADLVQVADLLSNRSLPLEAQELEYGLTPLPLAMIAVGLAAGGLPALRRRWVALSVLLLVVLVPFALNTYAPVWTAWLESAPLFGSSSSLLRWYAVWVPLLIIVAVLMLARLPRVAHPATPLAVTLFIMLFQVQTEPLTYKTQRYNPDAVQQRWASTTAPRITQVHPSRDLTVGASQAYCRDDFFGYRMETFPFRLMWEGAPEVLRDGVYNMKNPACYVFPKENMCTPGDNFTAAERTNLEAFIAYKPIVFAASRAQRVANILSLAGLVGVALLLGFGTLSRWLVSNVQAREDVEDSDAKGGPPRA